MACHGICIQYKAKGAMPKGGRYLAGQKRCHTCSEYIVFDGRLCPCCRLTLRTHPRNKKYKEQLRERKGITAA